jgi:hypothetical protein
MARPASVERQGVALLPVPAQRALESAVVDVAQALAAEEPCGAASELVLSAVGGWLRARQPHLRSHDFAGYLLIARRACVRDALDGD